MAPKFRQRCDRMPAFIASAYDAHDRGRNARNSAWLGSLKRSVYCIYVDCLCRLLDLASFGAACFSRVPDFSQQVPDYVSVQPSKFDRFCRNAPSIHRILSFLE